MSIKELFEAVYVGNLAKVESLLEDGKLNVNVPWNNETVLRQAVKAGRVDILERLLAEKGINVNAVDRNRDSALSFAARNGNVEMVNILIRAGAEFTASDKKSLIFSAAYACHTEMAEILIKNGANVNALNSEKYSPLSYAIKRSTANDSSKAEFVKMLLQHGASMEGYSELIYAALCGELEIVKLLIEYVADQDKKNALTLAAEKGCEGVVNLFIEDGVDFLNYNDQDIALNLAIIHKQTDIARILIRDADIDINDQGHNDMSALENAISDGQVEAVRMLLQEGANGAGKLHSAITYGQKIEFVKMFIQEGDDVNAVSYEHTPLMLAAECLSEEIVRILLDEGADVNAGKSALIIVAQQNDSSVEIVRMLIQAGVNVHAVDEQGNNALTYAARNGHVEIVKELLKAIGDVKLCDKRALIAAVKNGYVEVVKELLQAGMNVRDKNDLGKNALMCFVEKACSDSWRGGGWLTPDYVGGQKESTFDEMVTLLTKAGLKINARDNGGNSALMLVAMRSEVVADFVAKNLIRRGAFVEAKNAEGTTALMLASKQGNAVLAKTLVNCGAFIDNRNHQRQTALTIALQNGKMNVVEMLLGLGTDVVDNYAVVMHYAKNDEAKGLVHSRMVAVALGSGKKLTNEDLAVAKSEKDVMRKEIKCQASLNQRLFLHVIKHAEGNLKNWLSLDNQDHIELKSAYMKLSSMVQDSYFCALKMRAFENRINYKAIDEKDFVKSPNIAEFDVEKRYEKDEKLSGILFQWIEEGVLQKIEKILEKKDLSLEDVQFALDFIHHEFMERSRVFYGCEQASAGFKTGATFKKLSEQEEKLEDELLGKAGLNPVVNPVVNPVESKKRKGNSESQDVQDDKKQVVGEEEQQRAVSKTNFVARSRSSSPSRGAGV